MPSHKRRPNARRRAWGRGPVILPFEPLEGRQLLTSTPAAVSTPLPDLVATAFNASSHNVDWGGGFQVSGYVMNQGAGPTTAPVTVGIFASPTNAIGPGSVQIGTETIPAGLAPGASYSFLDNLTLPLAAIPGVGSSNSNSVFVEMRLDTTNAQPETNKLNNEGRGVGLDTQIITITPPAPSNLVGTSLSINPSTTTWGSTFLVTAQIKNNAQGNAPATRARLVLTPSGSIPGGPADFTVASVAIPPIPAWQTANVTQQITLPSLPPSSLASSTAFTLTLVQDADYITNPMYNHTVAAGLGMDQALMTINAGTTPYTAPTALPDLAPSSVGVSTQNLIWGTSFQAAATIQNLGQANAPSFRVRFLLTGTSGTTNQAVVLGDTIVPGLAAGGSTTVNPTLTLPRRLPYGSVVSGLAYGRIVVLVDPEQSVDQSIRTNNSAASAPVVLRVLGTNGSSNVPTGPPITYTTTGVSAATPAAAKTPTKVKVVKTVVHRRPHYAKRLPPKKQNAVTHQLTNIGNKLSKAFKDLTKI